MTFGSSMGRHNPVCDCQTCLMQEVIGLLRFILQELRQSKPEPEIAKPAKRKHDR